MTQLDNPFGHGGFLSRYMTLRDNPIGQNALLDLPTIFSLFPDVSGCSVLDFGCGTGDVCRYAIEQGAYSATGIDRSQKMVDIARQRTTDPRVTYVASDILDFNFDGYVFDVIVSSLTLHYIDRYDDLLARVRNSLRPGGVFLFSVEHPIYTAPVAGWSRTHDGARDESTPLDYGTEGMRTVPWLGFEVIKYHRKIETYVAGLIKWGFTLRAIREPQPSAYHLSLNPHLKYEVLTPPFLVISTSA